MTSRPSSLPLPPSNLKVELGVKLRIKGNYGLVEALANANGVRSTCDVG